MFLFYAYIHSIIPSIGELELSYYLKG